MTVAQLTLDLPHRAALGAEDFLVSDCNMAAVKLIDSWPAWQDNLQLLIGPAASGKTHLARVWQARSGACSLNPDNLGIDFVDAMGAGTPLVVEDVRDDKTSGGRVFSKTDVNITCPWHGMEFDIRTGMHPYDKRYRLKKLKVRVEDDHLYVDVPKARE